MRSSSGSRSSVPKRRGTERPSGLLAGANLSARFCGFLLCATWLSTAGFHVLAAMGGLRLGYGLVLAGSGAAAAVLWLQAEPARSARLRADVRGVASATLAVGKSAPLLSGRTL